MKNQKFSVKIKDREFLVNSEDISSIQDPQHNRIQTIWKNMVYNADLLSLDPNQKSVSLRLNGRKYQVNIQDELDAMIQSLGLNAKVKHTQDTLKAPMPGLVVQIFVEEGQTVVAGDSLIGLEAMKMENILKAHFPATIKRIFVNKSDKVDKAQVLIEFEAK